MLKKKRKALFSIMAAVVIITAISAAWYFMPKTFLEGVGAVDVKFISVFDGNTGKSFYVDKPEEITYIVENIQNIKMKRDKISVSYSGYFFRMIFCDENEKVVGHFIMNSADTIRRDPFFYRCDGGLCFDYLKELEGKYAG